MIDEKGSDMFDEKAFYERVIANLIKAGVFSQAAFDKAVLDWKAAQESLILSDSAKECRLSEAGGRHYWVIVQWSWGESGSIMGSSPISIHESEAIAKLRLQRAGWAQMNFRLQWIHPDSSKTCTIACVPFYGGA